MIHSRLVAYYPPPFMHTVMKTMRHNVCLLIRRELFSRVTFSQQGIAKFIIIQRTIGIYVLYVHNVMQYKTFK